MRNTKYPQHTQGRFRESISAMQSGLSVDPNNAVQIKEKADTEACMRREQSAKELLSQVGAVYGVVGLYGEIFVL